MAKGSDFETEEFVVYPTHGVGRILGTEKQEIAGTSAQHKGAATVRTACLQRMTRQLR